MELGLKFKSHILDLMVLLSHLSPQKVPSAPLCETILQVTRDWNRVILKLPLLLVALISCIKNSHWSGIWQLCAAPEM